MTEFFDDNTNAVHAAGYDRPVGDPNQSRSVVLAKHGIVATSHMIGLVEPMSCGIGGDLFAIYWDHETQKLYGLNASGRSPSNLSRDEFMRRGDDNIPTFGPLSWSVPGCVSGWQELHDRFGSKSFDELLAPAIATGEEGFPVSEVIAGSWNGATARLKEWPDSAKTDLVDGKRAPKFGEVFTNPRLAASYRRIATDGPEAFYQGDIAKAIVAFSEANGGFLSMSDFIEHEAEWVTPVSTNYRGYELWELPPNGQGIAALQILNTLEPFDIKSMGFGSPEYLHLFIEAKKLAFADRAQFYADPAFNNLPTAELISKQYAARRAERIDLNRAATDVPAGDPKLVHGDTIYLTVVDKNRNCCSFIQSNYYGFGSQIVPGDVGFALQNRGALFTLEEGHLNVYEPRKRPFHTIIPAMLTKEGEPYFCFGVMGGDMQPQGHAQVVVNLIDFGMNVQAAGDAARVRHVGSAQPTGVAARGSGTVQVESGISSETVDALRAKGHQVVRAKGAFGGYQGILIDRENGVLHGATEARKDGAAVGY
jgi:gamma-glutamyltranspeptidase/glutathione hydrolase